MTQAKAPPVPLTPEQQRLMEKHFPFAYYLARRLARRHGLPLEEARDEALAALCSSAAGYDPAKINPASGKPYAFTTYASKSIIHRIYNLGKKRSATPRELQTRRFLVGHCSAYQGADDSARATPDLIDILQAPPTEPDNTEEIELLRCRVQELPDRYAVVVEHQLKGMGLRQSAKILGVSRERVRQLRDIAVRKLRVMYQSRE